MSPEELLLIYWRQLPTTEQTQVLQLARSLQTQQTPEPVDRDLGAPEHLEVRSAEQLKKLLQAGLDSLNRGEGIEATDDWWEQTRSRLIVRAGQNSQP
jgi:hypothetical protein